MYRNIFDSFKIKFDEKIPTCPLKLDYAWKISALSSFGSSKWDFLWAKTFDGKT